LPINRQKLLHHLDFERRTLARSGEILEQLPTVSRLTSPDGSRHTIIYSSLDTQNADAAVAQEVGYYRSLDVEVEWKLYQHDSPPDLLNRLEYQGFETGEREAVLVLDLLDHHDWLDAPLAYRVERVSNAEQVDLYRQTAQNIFKKDYRFTASELLHGIQNGSSEHVGYVCFDGPIPVSIGRLYTHLQSALGGLYGGATLPTHRCQGFYRCVTAARGRDARAMGARFLIVDALPTSSPILQKLGFVEVSQTWPCVLKRDSGMGGSPMSFRVLGEKHGRAAQATKERPVAGP
jgi:hypothetical protein